jgi:hypothetical protein
VDRADARSGTRRARRHHPDADRGLALTGTLAVARVLPTALVAVNVTEQLPSTEGCTGFCVVAVDPSAKAPDHAAGEPGRGVAELHRRRSLPPGHRGAERRRLGRERRRCAGRRVGGQYGWGGLVAAQHVDVTGGTANGVADPPGLPLPQLAGRRARSQPADAVPALIDQVTGPVAPTLPPERWASSET